MRLSILSPSRFVVAGLLLGFLPATQDCILGADSTDLSVPVRVIGAARAAEPQNMRMTRRPAATATPTRGLPPQYQSARGFRADAGKAPNPEQSALRFLLAMPKQLLLVEASVTIDGQPYEMIREERIDRLIAELKKPMQPAPAEPSAEAADEAESTEAECTEAESTEAESTEAEGSEAEDEAEDPAAEDGDEEAEAEVPLLPQPSPGLEARLRRYATVTGRPPSRDELRWLLTKWVDGPTLLLLDENFQRFRGSQAPAFYVLDRDMDGTVSPAELEAAEKTLLSCDVNQNDVVEYTEIAEVADDPRRQRKAASVQALIPILDGASVAAAFGRLAKRYSAPESLQRIDANSDGGLDATEIAKLGEMEPDVRITVAFDATDPAKSATTVTYISPALAPEQTRSLASSITLPLGESSLEFSAVQSAALSGADQISVGIVNDGYPLLPAIDPNEDGRLTIRELRSVVDHLRAVDIDKDGGISPAELPSTIRLSFGLGPSVHRHLADIRTVHAPVRTTPVAAPGWFKQMDRNKDGDISRREFTLRPEHFKRLDADNDGLISPAEAVEPNKDEPQDVNKPTDQPETETVSP